MALVGCASGAKTLREVEALSQDLDPVIRKGLGIQRLVPDTTLRDLLVVVDPTELRGAMIRGVKARLRGKSVKHDRAPGGVVSIDGKTTRTRLVVGPYAQRVEGATLYGLVRTLSCTLISSNAFPCLDAVPIPAETNETGHFRVAFEGLCHHYDSHFEMVMGDAAFATAANADLVATAGKAYTFQLKENGPTLLAEATALLSGDKVTEKRGEAEREDGRFVARRLRIVDVNTTAQNQVVWPTARRVMSVERLHVDAHNHVVAVLGIRYFITNQRPGRYSETQWLRTLRDRWAVENQTHGTLDIAFQEDDYPWIDEPQGMVNVTRGCQSR